MGAPLQHKSLHDLLQEAGNPLTLLRNSQTGPYVYPVAPVEFSTYILATGWGPLTVSAVLRPCESRGMEDAHLGMRSRCDAGPTGRTHPGTAGDLLAQRAPGAFAATGAIAFNTEKLP
jgi:hypothetical protein